MNNIQLYVAIGVVCASLKHALLYFQDRLSIASMEEELSKEYPSHLVSQVRPFFWSLRVLFILFCICVWPVVIFETLRSPLTWNFKKK
jgi:hypothetical protein